MSGNVLPRLRQCCHTPIRDLLKAQFTGRLNWKLALRQSNLPAEIQTAIYAVVAQSRLFRIEKAEVCAELIAHFQDGLRAGQSGEQLLDQFGDIRVAANLIGRSKRRNRSIFMKLGKILGYAGLGLIAAYVGMGIYFWMGRANPKFDFLVDVNKIAVTETDENKQAWPIYRDAWIRYGVLDYERNKRKDDIFYRDEQSEQSGRLLKPTDEQWPKAVKYLRDHKELLDAYRAAGKIPILGLELQRTISDYDQRDLMALFPNALDENGKLLPDHSTGMEAASEDYNTVMDGSLVNLLLPHVSEFRHIVQILTVDTRLAVQEGDRGRAIENIKTIFSVANHAAEAPVLVCGLVGLATDGMGFDLIEEVVTEDPDFLLDNQLADLQHLVANLSIRDHMQLAGERALTYDIIQRVYTDDGDGDGRLTMQGAASLEMMNWRQPSTAMRIILDKIATPATMFMAASRKEVTETYDQLMDEAEAAFDSPLATYDWRHDETLTDVGNKFPLLGLVLPAIDNLRCAMEQTMARRDAVEMALACERFRMENGSYPENANQLAPDFMATLPTDPLTGNSLGLTKGEGRVTIYSVGNNLTDDGGIQSIDPRSGEPIEFHCGFLSPAAQHMVDGDWILWPRNP